MDIRNTIREILTSTVKTDVVGASALKDVLNFKNTKFTPVKSNSGRISGATGGYIKIGDWVYLNFYFKMNTTIQNNSFGALLDELPKPKYINGFGNATIIIRAIGATNSDNVLLHGQIISNGQLQVFNNSGKAIDNNYTLRGTVTYIAD